MKINLKNIIFLPLLLINLTFYQQEIQAQNHSSSLKMPDLPDGGEPVGRRKGGAGRPECPAALTNLTAIVPGKGNKSFLGSTTSENTTFWVYFPQVKETVEYGEFILQEISNQPGSEGEEKDVFRQQLKLPNKSGFIGISLPKLPQYALKERRKYHIYFKVFCGNPQTTPEYFYVDAFLKKIAKTPELTWYDTLHKLALLRRQNPNNAKIQRDWIQLLKVADLENIAKNPIVEYYELKQ